MNLSRCLNLLLFFALPLFTLEVEHLLFRDLKKNQILSLTSENQHVFLDLQQAILLKLQELANQKIDDVHELIHVENSSSFAPLKNTLCYQFYVHADQEPNTLSTKLSISTLDNSISGRTYVFRDDKGVFYGLNFSESTPGSCSQIFFSRLDHPIMLERLEKILDYLLLYDKNFLFLPIKMLLVANLSQ